MNTLSDMKRAVESDPANRTLRLAYADALQEAGDAEEPCPKCDGRGQWRVWACKVCGAEPDEYGQVEHGKGCYRLSADGGGVEYVDLDPCPQCRGARTVPVRNLEEAALQRVLAEPHDDRHRLDYAAEVNDVVKAETIRTQVAGGVQWVRLQHLAEFEAVLGRPPHQVGRKSYAGGCDVGNTDSDVRLVWRRGFLTEVACPAQTWLEHGDALTARHPITEVRLTTGVDWFSGPNDSVVLHEDGIVGCQHICQRVRYGQWWGHTGTIPQYILAAEWPTVETWHLPPQ